MKKNGKKEGNSLGYVLLKNTFIFCIFIILIFIFTENFIVFLIAQTVNNGIPGVDKTLYTAPADINQPSRWRTEKMPQDIEVPSAVIAQYPEEMKKRWNNHELAEKQKKESFKIKYGIELSGEISGSRLEKIKINDVLVNNKAIVIIEDAKKRGIEKINLNAKGNVELYYKNIKVFDFNKGIFNATTKVEKLPPINPRGNTTIEKLQQTMYNFQQITNILDKIGVSAKSNGAGKTNINSRGNEADVSINNGAQVSVTSTATQDNSQNEIRLQQNNDKKEAKFTIDDKLNGRLEGNNIYSIPEVGAVVTEEDSPKTEVINNAETKNPTLEATTSRELVIKEILAAEEARKKNTEKTKNSVTGSAILGEGSQVVKFLGQDIIIDGIKISVYIFKPFEKISGNGNQLYLKNGLGTIGFNKEMTYYDRKIEKNDFFINDIYNENDIKNHFMIVPADELANENRNCLIDYERRLSVGCDTIKNPMYYDEFYKNIDIPIERAHMWEKAAGKI